MKITLEFEHPCELIVLLEKLAQCYVLPTATAKSALDELLIQDRITNTNKFNITE